MTRVEKGLPQARYPVLRERFDHYSNIRKLIGPHVGSRGAKIVLDADILFYGRPDEMLGWWAEPEKILCATDIVESYGYPRTEMEKLAGGSLPAKVNVGLTGLCSESIDWDELEHWCQQLIRAYRPHYYLEQALIAMMCVKRGLQQLDKDRYITGPSEVQALAGAGIMQHYVDLSKKWYFRTNWRKVLPGGGGPASPPEREHWLDRLIPQKRIFPKPLGIAKTYLYRKPADEIRRMRRWGLQGYFRTPVWAAQMERAAEELRPRKADEGKPARQVWFLSGRAHWYQTVFCAWTFQRWSRFRVVPVIVDDGSFDEEVQAKFARIFPDYLLYRRDDCNRKFAQEFPAMRYPMIHAVRKRQVLFRKLTKVFGRADEWRFLMDSDMLFFSEPREIDDLLEQGREIFVQRDCWESYGYSRALLERLAGRPLPEAVNIGIVQYNGARTDWDQVERWLTEMVTAEGMAYNVTQGTFATVLASQSIRFLDREQYRVIPRNPAAGEALPICGHYVADSKPWYFGQGWKKALELAGA